MIPTRLLKLLPVLALLPAAGTARAELRELPGLGATLQWDSRQLPQAQWQVQAGLQSAPSYFEVGVGVGNNFGWIVDPGGPYVVSLIAATPNAGLPDLDLHLDFTPWRMTLGDRPFELLLRLQPSQLRVVSSSLLTAPAQAQLATAYGLDQLEVTANGSERLTKTSRPIAPAGPWVSMQTVEYPAGEGWQTAPQTGDGSWSLSISQTLIGSYHLVPSLDTGCQSLLCMPGERADATLQRLDLYIPVQFEMRALTSAVPEPGALNLLVLGLVGLWGLHRRSVR